MLNIQEPSERVEGLGHERLRFFVGMHRSIFRINSGEQAENIAYIPNQVPPRALEFATQTWTPTIPDTMLRPTPSLTSLPYSHLLKVVHENNNKTLKTVAIIENNCK